MVIAASVRAAAHRDDPPWVWHLVVDLPQRRSHFVRQRAGHDHDVGLARAGAEDDAQAILVVARRGEVHHFDGAAGETEGHGPEGPLAGPIGDLVDGCSEARRVSVICRCREREDIRCRGSLQCVLHDALFLFLAGERDFSPWFAGGGERWTLRIL